MNLEIIEIFTRLLDVLEILEPDFLEFFIRYFVKVFKTKIKNEKKEKSNTNDNQ